MTTGGQSCADSGPQQLLVFLIALSQALAAQHGTTWSTRVLQWRVTTRVWQQSVAHPGDPVEVCLLAVEGALAYGASHREPVGPDAAVRTVLEVVIPTARSVQPPALLPVALQAVTEYVASTTPAPGAAPPGVHPTVLVLRQEVGPEAPARPTPIGALSVPR